MDDVKRLGTPLLIIVLSAFLTKLVETWLKGGFVHTLLIIIMVASLFMFGVSLNRKKRSNAVFRKVVAIAAALYAAGLSGSCHCEPLVCIPWHGVLLHQYAIYILRLSVRGLGGDYVWIFF